LRDGLALVGAPTSPVFTEGGPPVGVGHLHGRDQGGADEWGLLRRFFNGDPDDFGTAVAVDGDVVVIGAPDDVPGEAGGRVWIYEKEPADPWTVDPGLAQVVAAPDSAAEDDFGSALALDGGTLFTSAPRLAPGTGSVYRLTRAAQDAWSTPTLLPNATAGPRYGFALAFQAAASGRLLVGSPLGDAAFFPFASLVISASDFETGDLSEWSH
jgi:hypothetical protein